jgi:glycosyltransferase involved in cell wall biosynthesis
VHRIALRGWDGALADPDDVRERDRTRVVLQQGAFPVLAATLAQAIARPLAFLAAARLATRMAAGSDRSLVYHWIYLGEACVVARWLRAAGVRHVHAHFGTNSAEVAMLAAALGATSYSFTVHGPDEFDRPRAIGLAEKIRRAGFVVGISSFTRSQLFRWVESAHWDKIHVVHCGIDGAFHAGSPAPPSEAKRLVCVGRLGEQKGHLLLLAAMQRAFERGVVFDLVLAGDGDLRGEIEARARTLGLAGHVRITAGSAAPRSAPRSRRHAPSCCRASPKGCRS